MTTNIKYRNAGYEKRRPSELDALAVCPRYRRPDWVEDNQNDAAAEGSMLHDIMEKAVGSGTTGVNPVEYISTVTGVSPSQKVDLMDAAEQYLSLMSCVPPGLGKPTVLTEIKADNGVTRAGRLDLVICARNETQVHYELIDWKFTRNESAHEAQGKAYAVSLLQQAVSEEGHLGPKALPHNVTLNFRTISPRIVAESEVYSFTGNDIAMLEEELFRIQDDASNPWLPPASGPQCVFCRWCGKDCPAMGTQVVELSRAAGAAPLPMRVFRQPADATERGMRRAVMDWLLKCCESIKEDDLEHYRTTEETPDGYIFVQTKGSSVLPKEQNINAYDRLVDLYGDRAALTIMLDSAKLSLTSMSEGASKLFGLPPLEERRRISESVKDLMTTSGGSAYLRRRMSKQTPEDLYESLRASGANLIQ